MRAILLRLVGPMQSWGTRSRYNNRDTQPEPSKSGVIGIVASALGRQRSDDISDLTALQMGVRVDREGLKVTDYQTAGGGNAPQHYLNMHGITYYGVSCASTGRPHKNPKFRTVVTRRYYMSDAKYLVALAGSADTMDRIADALASPAHPLFLGRKSFVPSEPILYNLRAICEMQKAALPNCEDPDSPFRFGDTVCDVLESEPWLPEYHELQLDRETQQRVPVATSLRLVVEVGDDEHDDAVRCQDHPVSYAHNRECRERFTRVIFTKEPIKRWIETNMQFAERSYDA